MCQRRDVLAHLLKHIVLARFRGQSDACGHRNEEQGTEREAGAKQALADVYATFTEGFDVPDLVAARAVLDGA